MGPKANIKQSTLRKNATQKGSNSTAPSAEKKHARPRPDWDTSLQDPSSYRMTAEELEAKRRALASKNRVRIPPSALQDWHPLFVHAENGEDHGRKDREEPPKAAKAAQSQAASHTKKAPGSGAANGRPTAAASRPQSPLPRTGNASVFAKLNGTAFRGYLSRGRVDLESTSSALPETDSPPHGGSSPAHVGAENAANGTGEHGMNGGVATSEEREVAATTLKSAEATLPMDREAVLATSNEAGGEATLQVREATAEAAAVSEEGEGPATLKEREAATAKKVGDDATIDGRDGAPPSPPEDGATNVKGGGELKGEETLKDSNGSISGEGQGRLAEGAAHGGANGHASTEEIVEVVGVASGDVPRMNGTAHLAEDCIVQQRGGAERDAAVVPEELKKGADVDMRKTAELAPREAVDLVREVGEAGSDAKDVPQLLSKMAQVLRRYTREHDQLRNEFGEFKAHTVSVLTALQAQLQSILELSPLLSESAPSVGALRVQSDAPLAATPAADSQPSDRATLGVLPATKPEATAAPPPVLPEPRKLYGLPERAGWPPRLPQRGALSFWEGGADPASADGPPPADNPVKPPSLTANGPPPATSADSPSGSAPPDPRPSLTVTPAAASASAPPTTQPNPNPPPPSNPSPSNPSSSSPLNPSPNLPLLPHNGPTTTATSDPIQTSVTNPLFIDPPQFPESRRTRSSDFSRDGAPAPGPTIRIPLTSSEASTSAPLPTRRPPSPGRTSPPAPPPDGSAPQHLSSLLHAPKAPTGGPVPSSPAPPPPPVPASLAADALTWRPLAALLGPSGGGGRPNFGALLASTSATAVTVTAGLPPRAEHSPGRRTPPRHPASTLGGGGGISRGAARWGGGGREGKLLLYLGLSRQRGEGSDAAGLALRE